jgi:hypothetical protein
MAESYSTDGRSQQTSPCFHQIPMADMGLSATVIALREFNGVARVPRGKWRKISPAMT